MVRTVPGNVVNIAAMRQSWSSKASASIGSEYSACSISGVNGGGQRFEKLVKARLRIVQRAWLRPSVDIPNDGKPDGVTVSHLGPSTCFIPSETEKQ